LIYSLNYHKLFIDKMQEKILFVKFNKLQPVRSHQRQSRAMHITIDKGTWQAEDKSGTHQNALSLIAL